MSLISYVKRSTHTLPLASNMLDVWTHDFPQNIESRVCGEQFMDGDKYLLLVVVLAVVLYHFDR